jgi:hypothetical protein
LRKVPPPLPEALHNSKQPQKGTLAHTETALKNIKNKLQQAEDFKGNQAGGSK